MESKREGVLLLSIFLGVGLVINYFIVSFLESSNNTLPSIYILNSIYIIGLIFGSIAFVKNNKQKEKSLINNIDNYEEYMEQIAQYNNLTNLPNRVSLEKYIDTKFEQGKGKDIMEILFLDIDGFKIVNETLGHKAGDEILNKIAIRIKKVLDNRGKMFHIRGDEFVILIDNEEHVNNSKSIAKDIIKSMKRCFDYEGKEFHLTSSMGLASYPDDGHNITELLKSGNLAMKNAKQNGKNKFMVYNPFMDTDMNRKMELVNELYKSLENEEFTLNYQPQINSITGEIIGLEALIRWNNNKLGSISPVEFIPIAEETGLIIEIGEWVLRTACKQNKLWQEQGYAPIPVAVNISGIEFQHPTFVDKIRDVLNDTGLDPEWLHLEITESVVIEDSKRAIEVLKELKKIGIQTALDDFGTGFSSLGYLNKFKINILKIDSSFIKEIKKEEYTITETIILLGKNLNMEVIAEGVETEEQLDYLQKAGCHKIQGYFYCEPLPTNKVEEQFSMA